MPVTFVVVKDNRTGHHYTVAADAVENEFHEVLTDRVAVDATGKPMPPKPQVELLNARDGQHVGDAPSQGAGEPEPVGYAERKKDDLLALIEERNSERDPDGETYIVPDAPGNKPDLVAALEADDIAQPHPGADADQA